MVNRDLQAVKAAISQQNTMQKRMEKMQMRSLYANNTAESLIKGAKKAGYTVPASAYQPVQQASQQTPQQSGGITADSLMKEYQQWLSEQQNTPKDLPSGGSAGSGYRQTLTTQDQQIPSLMDSVKNMSNDDIAKQINIANMVKDQKAQTQEEQDKNVADILSKLNGDSSMADKARQLLNQRNTDYTSQTGKTDYDEAVQRTLQSAIPSLADNQPQSTENAQKAAQTDAQSYSNEAIAKIMADAGGGDEKALLEQLNNDPDLAKKAQSVLNQRDSDYAALTEKEPETQQATQRASKPAKQAQSAYKQAQTATQTAKKKLETEQKKIDQNSQKLQSLQNSLAKAQKTAQKTGHYEQVNAIQQQIRGLQDTSADNKAFKKATEEYNKAKFNERAAKLKWANQALENPVTKNGEVLDVTAKPNDDQTLSTAQNLVSAAQNGKLTKSQKSEAKTLAKHYEDKIRKATLNGQSVSDDEMKTYTALKNATSAGASFMSGLANAFSTTKRMAQGVGNAIGKLTGEDNAGDELSQELQTTQETANNQNGIANVAGTMAGKGAQYALFNQLANAAGLTPAISNTMNEKLGLNAANVANTAKGVAGKKLTEQLADVIVGQAADTAFDTIPTIMDNVSTGKYAGDAGQLVNDVSANQMNNLAMNMGMNTIQSGVIPSISDALKNLLGKGQTAEDAVSNIAKNAAYTNDSNRTPLAYQSSEDAAEEARRMLSDELARQRVSVQSPEDANKEASDILSQYMNDTRGKENVQTGINNFINKAQNAQYPDEQAGSIVSAAKQNQKEIPSVKDAVEDSNVTNSIKDGSDWNPNKRISEILGRDVTMASDMDVPKDDIITSKVPSDTKSVSKSAKKEEIPSISINDAAKDNTNVDELNKRGQNAFDQLVNDVKKTEGKASDIPNMENGKAYTASGAVEKEVDPEDAVDLMSERMSKRKSKTDNEGYIGRGYTNTIKNSGLATDEQYVKGLDEQTRHFTVPEKESFETGKAIYDSNPKAFVQKYSSSMGKDQLKALGSSDVDAMHIAYGKLNQMAKNATDPVEAENLRRQASSIARNLTDAQHYNAQTLQANAKWRNNIDGALMSADGTMKRLRDEALSPKEHSQIDDASQKISEMLKKMLDGKMETTSDNQLAWQEVKKALDGYSQLKGKFTDKQIQNLTDSVLKDKDWNGIQDLLEMQMTGYGGVSSEAIDKATMLFDEAQKYNYNSRKYMDLEQEAYNVLAKDIQSQPGYKGASFGQKLDSFRYLMMLGNPKTQVKNIAGNFLFGKLTNLKDDIGAIIETAVDRANKASGGEGIQRTKSILNPLSESDSKLVSAAKEYGEEYAARALSGNKYTNPGVELDKALSTFGNGKVGRFVQGLSDLTTKSLDKADQKAMMNKYQNALARYVKANGKDISIFSDTSQEAKDFLSMASDYAVRQAEEAAFHQDSRLASGLTNFTTMLKNGNAGEKAAGTLIDATVPFKKTPINVLKSCLQYSPAEYAYAFADAYKLHRGEIDAAKFIDDMAKATTGTTMCGVGAVLAHEGIVQIGSDKGTKEQNTDTRTGRQQMAVKIGKHYVNLSDLVPAASPLIIGATMYEAFKKNGKGIDALIDGLSNVESGLVDTTMLSGLSSVLNSVQYMQQGEEPINAVTRSVAESYAGQFLPTLGRAINSTIDDTQRSSYSSKTGVGKEVESTAKYLETKIPGLQQVGDWADKNDIPVLNKLKLQPAIDAWGNVKKQNSAGVDAYTDNKVANAVGRGVANFATPTKLSADKSTDLDNKIRELKERLVSNGEMSAEDADNLFPYTATSEAKIGGEKLSEKDWTQYQIDKGTTSAELAKELLTSGHYDDLSDADKADILQKIYKFSKSNTAAEYGGSASSSNSKLSEAYKNGGAKAVIDSLIGSSEKSSFTNAVQASNSEGKASIDNVIDYLNAVEKKDPAQAKELASQASEYQSGTYKKQSGKWVYQNKNTTKTGTGKAVTIPGPDEVGLPKASTKASTESTEANPDMSSKLSEARKNKDKAIAAINRGESADSAVVNAGYWANRNYESRYSKYSAAKIPGLSKSEENFKLIYQTMDSDRNGNLKKKEVVDYINSQNLTAEQKRAMFSAFANKNWKNPY